MSPIHGGRDGSNWVGSGRSGKPWTSVQSTATGRISFRHYAVFPDNQEDRLEMGVLSPVPMHPSGRRHLGFLVIDKPQNLPRSYGRQPMLLWCNEIGAAGETATGKSVVSSTDARVSNIQKPDNWKLHVSSRERIGFVTIWDRTSRNLGSCTNIPTAHIDKLEKGKLPGSLSNRYCQDFPHPIAAAHHTHACAAHASLTRTISLSLPNHMCTVCAVWVLILFRTSHSQANRFDLILKLVMILSLVHQRKPCYDFYFL